MKSTPSRERLLTINAGSSSLRLSLIEMTAGVQQRLDTRHYSKRPENPEQSLREFLAEHEIQKVSAVAHRVVHGGLKLQTPCMLTKEVEQEIERLAALAPLHNPETLRWIRAAKSIFPDAVLQIAVFDTAFFADLPEVAFSYPLPRKLCQQFDIRRYGFHGLAHQGMWQRWSELKQEPGQGKNNIGGKVITLQLGAGCSAAAIVNGKPLDTSMGFSPLEGLMMATRSGDVDPGILLYLQQQANLSVEELDQLLHHSSGLLGVSGLSADMRELLTSQDPAAKLAVNLYCYRIRKYIGQYLNVLEGADAIIFGGGVGENAPTIREQILKGMEWCGLLLDEDANNNLSGMEACITKANGSIGAWVIPVDEARFLAEAASSFTK